MLSEMNLENLFLFVQFHYRFQFELEVLHQMRYNQKQKNAINGE